MSAGKRTCAVPVAARAIGAIALAWALARDCAAQEPEQPSTPVSAPSPAASASAAPSVAPPPSASLPAAAPEPAKALPSFAQLEAAGARIGEVRIRNRDIFDLDDPNEDKWLFRLANRLHIQTREGVIERALLFKQGDPVRASVIEETERVLRNTRYLYDAQLRPLAYHDGIVDIEVETRDTWTLDPGISAGRSGGTNSSSIQISEYNLLGTGVGISYGRSKNVDRTSNELTLLNDRAFGGSTSISYSRANNSDGKRESASVAHPFYALDTPWAAGASVSSDDRIESIYNAGSVQSQYRHRAHQTEVFGGWSTGRIEGWVKRYSIGLSRQDDRYALEPGLIAPAQLPPDDKLVTPFVRFELIEDRFEKLRNRNQIQRTEFFALGFVSSLQLGRASTGLGSTRDAWLYSGSVAKGFEPAPDQTLLTSAAISGQYAGGQVQRQRLGATAKYYLPQSRHWLFYAAAAGDLLTNPGPADSLELGGDNGLRGYPLRYQSGYRRALLTFEERAYTDVYLYRLFRIGAAAFLDTGRAWGSSNVNTANPGWLSNVGIGLRIFNERAAFSNVLHVDLAFPLDPDANVKRVQFGVKTKVSF